jgi:hypothetical protein
VDTWYGRKFLEHGGFVLHLLLGDVSTPGAALFEITNTRQPNPSKFNSDILQPSWSSSPRSGSVEDLVRRGNDGKIPILPSPLPCRNLSYFERDLDLQWSESDGSKTCKVLLSTPCVFPLKLFPHLFLGLRDGEMMEGESARIDGIDEDAPRFHGVCSEASDSPQRLLESVYIVC